MMKLPSFLLVAGFAASATAGAAAAPNTVNHINNTLNDH